MAVINNVLGKKDNTIVGVDTSGTAGTVIPNQQGVTQSVISTTPVANNPVTSTPTTVTDTLGTDKGTEQPTTSTNNLYYDVIAAQQTKPTYTPSKDTSSGAQAADGTMYSWDKQGIDAAQNQYQQDALKAKQDALANRQTIEQNALQYQQQADMMKYANNQDAEKVGWTGGYVLDQNRQMEYLKASIQAQMYGAMELQKYGYDSALAAARLSYDLNQKEFAHKYYQDAVNVAITEAQITGTYFSAETRDMMSQFNAADQELGLYDESGKALSLDKINEGINDGSIILTPEQERALAVKSNIEKWYTANEVSPTGIQTLAAWESEQAMAQDWADKQWEMYQAALDTATTKDAEDVNTFIKYDANGNPIYNGTTVELGSFRNMTTDEIIDYYNSTSSVGKEQVYGYIDNSFGQIVTNYLATVKTTDASGNVSYNVDANKLKGLIEANSKVTELKPILKNYSFDMPAGDASVEINIDANGNLTSKVTVADKPKGGSASSSIQTQVQAATTGANKFDTSITADEILKATVNDDMNDIFESHVTYSVKDESQIRGEGIDDDFDINLYWDNEEVKNYDIDVDWEYGSGWSRWWTANNFGKDTEIDGAKGAAAWDKAKKYLNETYPSLQKDSFVIYGDCLWYYNANLKKWGYVQDGAGGKKLKEDFIEAGKGNRPNRWY